MKKIILFLFFITSFNPLFPCECPTFSPITKEATTNYDVIFFGYVDSVSACDKKGSAVTYFTVSELYKGRVQKNVAINFDCLSECLMSFEKGQEWLIYATYKKFDYLTVNICSHSRKRFVNEAEDFYIMAAQRTITKEQQFLKESLGMQSLPQEGGQPIVTDIGTHNEQPSAISKLVLLIISLLAMVVVYFIMKKKK